MINGIKRFRWAIENQRDAGEGEFRLSFADAEAICKECEDELARVSWAEGVPAPVDADGEVVPLTTRVMYYGDSPRDVLGFHYNADNGWELYTTTLYTRLSTFNLHRPDSWERLEEDVRNAENSDACGYYGIGTEPCNEGCPGYKDLETPCAAIAMKDVLLRAKALAERDAKEAADHGVFYHETEVNGD